MKFYQRLFGLIWTLLVLCPNPLLAQPPGDKAQISKILDRLRLIQQDLENKVTICNGGKILTRTCPAPAEPTGSGSIVKALQHTKQTISTLERYLGSNLRKTNQK
jgi:hypothetical protein